MQATNSACMQTLDKIMGFSQEKKSAKTSKSVNAWKKKGTCLEGGRAELWLAASSPGLGLRSLTQTSIISADAPGEVHLRQPLSAGRW